MLFLKWALMGQTMVEKTYIDGPLSLAAKFPKLVGCQPPFPGLFVFPFMLTPRMIRSNTQGAVYLPECYLVYVVQLSLEFTRWT